MALYEAAPDRKKLLGQLIWFLFFVALTAIGAYLTPDKSGHGTHRQLGLPPCPSVLLFDRPCPGCGLTTSWTALIHGQLAESFHAHPLGPALYVLFAVSAFMSLYAWVKKLRFSTTSKEFNRVLVVTAVIFLAFGFTRMALTPHFGTDQEHWAAVLSGHQ